MSLRQVGHVAIVLLMSAVCGYTARLLWLAVSQDRRSGLRLSWRNYEIAVVFLVLSAVLLYLTVVHFLF